MKRNAVTVYGFVLGSQLLAVMEDAERSREDTELGEDTEFKKKKLTARNARILSAERRYAVTRFLVPDQEPF